MAVFVQTLSAAEVLAAITTDDTKFPGADIPDIPVTLERVKKTVYQNAVSIWNKLADGTVEMPICENGTLIYTGAWTMELEWTTLQSSSIRVSQYPFYIDPTHLIGNTVYDNTSNSPLCFKNEGGGAVNLIVAGSLFGGAKATTKLTRNLSGDFELFKAGVSIGTATDTYVPAGAPKGIMLCTASGGDAAVVEINNVEYRQVDF